MPAYSTRLDPPAAFLDVSIINPYLPDHALVKPAILDTAADVTAIPQSAVRALRLVEAQTVKISGIDDISVQRPTYVVTLEVADTTIERISVTEWAGTEILLGRDVLNQFEIKLDGKLRQFEIHDP